MTTVADIQKKYMMPIKVSFKKEIEKYISVPEVQLLVNKAMRCELTRNDNKVLYEEGNRKNGKYPYLYWLCCIYIHPLTIAQHIVKEVSRIN